MIRLGCDVHSKSEACGLFFRVNLKLIARVKGADFSLWNRKERCNAWAASASSTSRQGAGHELARVLSAAWPEDRP